MTQAVLAQALDLTQAQSIAALAAARTVVEADGMQLGARSTQLLDVLSRTLGIVDWRDRIEGSDIAASFPSFGARRALVDALLIAACIEGQVSSARQVAVESIARHLGVRSHWVELLDALRRHRVLRVKRALMTRSPDARRIFSRLWEEEGVLGILSAITFVLGFYRDRSLASRFRGLKGCPGGSFGRAVIDHFEARGFSFPGERGGIPERMVHHDLMHVLNGYDTDAAGECELAGFYAGCADGDSFTFIVTALATFHLELRVSPSIVQPARGAFDPERVLAAFLRGRRLCVDVMGRWDYWELMPLSLEEARMRLGIGAISSPSS